MSIQSSIKSAACLAAELQFNTNDEMKVLVCSSRVAAESLNLQHSGWNMIVIDLVLINTLIQMAGRLFRFGQKRPQTIKVLTVDESYNQYIQANNVVRYCAQIAANADLSTDPSILAAACEAAAQHYAANKGVDVEAYTQYLLEKARDAQLDGLVRSSLSIRSDRAPWKDSTLNLAEKNILPMECLFQLSQGGELAQLMGAQSLDSIEIEADRNVAEATHGLKTVSVSSSTGGLLPRLQLLEVSDEIYALYHLDVVDILKEVTSWGADCKYAEDALKLYLEMNSTSTGAADGSSTGAADGTSTTPADSTSTTPADSTSTTPASGTSTTPASGTSVGGKRQADKRRLSPQPQVVGSKRRHVDAAKEDNSKAGIVDVEEDDAEMEDGIAEGREGIADSDEGEEDILRDREGIADSDEGEEDILRGREGVGDQAVHDRVADGSSEHERLVHEKEIALMHLTRQAALQQFC
ncbi:hypothetical protein LTS02_010347 [Friedmanniomyces endolithicus]|nr:hypothetical protein LTS02_010347 [Friedmanniomyces endolithicus]